MKIVFNYNEHRISYYFWGRKKGKKDFVRSDVYIRWKDVTNDTCDIQTICYFRQKYIDIAIIAKESGHETKI